jgi:hypothetical protein
MAVVERGWVGVEAERVHGLADLGNRAVQPQVLVGRVDGHQATSWQTGQVRRRLRRSARAWVAAVASWNPQVGQEATHRPASRCSAAGWSPSSTGPGSWAWVMAVSWSQPWWVISFAAAHGSGQLTVSQHWSQVTAMAPSSVGVV